MNAAFKTLVEEEELNFLLEKYLIEARRKEIKNNYGRSLKEFKENKLEFLSDINRLKGLLIK